MQPRPHVWVLTDGKERCVDPKLVCAVIVQSFCVEVLENLDGSRPTLGVRRSTSLSRHTWCTLTLVALSSKVVLSRFCSNPNVTLDSFVSARRTCHCVLFWTPDDLRVPPKLPRQLGILSCVSNFSIGIQMEVMRLRFISLLAMQNSFHHMGLPERIRPFFFFA